MGKYINPGNKDFRDIISQDYVDKTMLIDLINREVNRISKLTLVSSPCLSGKTYNAKMLSAYYDAGCDSHSLFDNRKIASTEDYEKHINKYNVIYFDMEEFTSKVLSDGIPLQEVSNMISEVLSDELDMMFDASRHEECLVKKMLDAIEESGRKFVFIIDNWDAVIREAENDEEARIIYLSFLRMWFKNGNFTPKAVAAAYMTGLLPMDGCSEYFLSDFNEYTMVWPCRYAEFVGFTEDEVKNLCKENNVDYETMHYWYSGYSFSSAGTLYNPYSVMKAVRNREFDSCWTDAADQGTMARCLSSDCKGLSRTIAGIVGGIEEKVDIARNFIPFRRKDDVLTLFIHLGYLAYDSKTETVHIPNEEIRGKFQRAIHTVKLEESVRRLEESEKLFADTLAGNEEAVAKQIEKIHREEMFPLNYNSEASLRSVIKLAYYTCRDHYLQLEELPAGDGYADVVYLPLHSSRPAAMIIELKWDKSAEGAIAQILDRKYPDVLKNHRGDMLLVGINYDKDDRTHTCRIVREHR